LSNHWKYRKNRDHSYVAPCIYKKKCIYIYIFFFPALPIYVCVRARARACVCVCVCVYIKYLSLHALLYIFFSYTYLEHNFEQRWSFHVCSKLARDASLLLSFLHSFSFSSILVDSFTNTIQLPYRCVLCYTNLSIL